MEKRSSDVSAIALMARETRLREGRVPANLGHEELSAGRYLLEGDAFLLRAASGLAYFYRKGEGITASRPQGYSPSEDELWLNGSVYAAVACINGLYPVHASAVAFRGQVHAFTGPSGAGKSTLVAQLARGGLPLFCDDTLVLDLSDPVRPLCLPGHKRLKLCADALELTGAGAQEQVLPGLAKYYAEPAGDRIAQVLPLAELTFLEVGEPARFEVLSGAEKLMRLQDDHYTTGLFLAANQPDRRARFSQLANLARAVRLSRFVRPFDPSRFALDAALAERHVRQANSGGTGQ